MADQLAQFGMIGLGVMGENLALNVEDHGFRVAVWNLEGEWVDRFINKESRQEPHRHEDVRRFHARARAPRKIMMMIPAGRPVDQTIEAIKPHPRAGRHPHRRRQLILQDTQERTKRLEATGIHFVGSGVSAVKKARVTARR